MALAIGLRDQWRRQRLPADLQAEVLPNNILMVGPTGVGKTEVARRLARLARAPFAKVEATKFTEVGIYGQDTESMIADLVDNAAQQAEERAKEAERPAARERAISRVVAAIGWKDESERDSICNMLREGKMDSTKVSMAMPPKRGKGGGGRGGGGGMGMPFSLGMPKGLADALKNMPKGGSPAGVSISAINLDDILRGGGKGGLGGGGGGDGSGVEEDDERKEEVTVGEALPRLEEEEMESVLDGLDIDALAVEQAEERGIVFIDEVDKLVRRDGMSSGGGAFSKGEGVQKEVSGCLEPSSPSSPYPNPSPASPSRPLFPPRTQSTLLLVPSSLPFFCTSSSHHLLFSPHLLCTAARAARGNQRPHATWPRLHITHPLRVRWRLPPEQAGRPAAGAPGPPARARRAQIAH